MKARLVGDGCAMTPATTRRHRLTLGGIRDSQWSEGHGRLPGVPRGPHRRLNLLGSVDSQHLGDDDEGDHDEVHYSEDTYRNGVKPTTQVAGREILGQVGRSGKKVLHDVI